MVLDYDKETQIATIEQRNRMFIGEEIEIFGPGVDYFTQKIDKMWDDSGNEIEVAPHAQQIIKMKLENEVSKYYLLRKVREE